MREGRIYCWNKETRRVTVFDIRDADIKDCPERVIQAFIENTQEAGNET
jgi:hypothetical protein